MKLLKEDNFFREIDIGIASNRPMAFLHRTEINDGGFTNLNRESRVFSSAVHLKNLEVSFLFSKNELRTLKSIARNNASKTLPRCWFFQKKYIDFKKRNFTTGVVCSIYEIPISSTNAKIIFFQSRIYFFFAL